MEINIGDLVRFKDFKYLKKHHPNRFRWRLFELSQREAEIIGVNPDGTYIVDKDRDFPVTQDMFNKLSEEDVRFIKAFTLNKQKH